MSELVTCYLHNITYDPITHTCIQCLEENRLANFGGSGIVYSADYTATYTNRSLVDKIYIHHPWKMVHAAEKYLKEHMVLLLYFYSQDNHGFYDHDSLTPLKDEDFLEIDLDDMEPLFEIKELLSDHEIIVFKVYDDGTIFNINTIAITTTFWGYGMDSAIEKYKSRVGQTAKSLVS